MNLSDSISVNVKEQGGFKIFTIKQEDGDSVYLTGDEMDALINFGGEQLQK